MDWQWIVGAVGYVGVVVFVLLWRLERAKRFQVIEEFKMVDNQRVTAEATVAELRRGQEAERAALKRLRDINEKMQAAIDRLPDTSRDDLLEFMRNGSTG